MKKQTNVVESFQKHFSELRAESGLSQAKLGKELGLSAATIGYYENGDRLPDIEIAARIATYFHVSVDYLLGLSECKSAEPDVKVACKVTGLSEKAIENVSNSPIFKPDWYKENLLEICCAILESKDFYYILRKISSVVSATEWETAFDSNEKEKISKKYGIQPGTYVKGYSLATTKIHLESAKKLFPTGYCIQPFKEKTVAAKFDLENEFRKMYESVVNNLVDHEKINRIIEKMGDYDISEYIEKIFMSTQSEEEAVTHDETDSQPE